MFNLKKIKTAAVQNSEGMLEGTLERKQSLDGDTLGNTDWLLRKVRQDTVIDATTESQLTKSHKDTAKGWLTEGQLEKYEAPEGAVPGRAKGIDDLQMPPLAAVNAAYEAEQIEAFNKASEKSNDTSFWDKFLGVQMDGEKTTVPGPVPMSGSQLQNNYERLKSLKVEDMGKHEKVKKMVMASMRDADAMLFYIYHKAAENNRVLTQEENAIVDEITSDKIRFASML